MKSGYRHPDSLDLRDRGLVTGVKDQGQCGSCYIFSAVGSLEGVWKRRTGDLWSMSEQQVLDCNTYDDGCNGGNMINVFK